MHLWDGECGRGCGSCYLSICCAYSYLFSNCVHFSYGVFGTMYMCVAPESSMPFFSGGKYLSVLFDTYELLVGIQLKLASYFQLSLLEFLSTTVLA